MSGRGAAAGISDGAVRARTGRTWSEWFRVLDAVGARAMDHKAIVAYLSQRRGGGGRTQRPAALPPFGIDIRTLVRIMD